MQVGRGVDIIRVHHARNMLQRADESMLLQTKSLSFCPQRFVSDDDTEALLRLLRSGKQVAVMAHVNHQRELDTPVAKEYRHAICSASNDAKQDYYDSDDQ